VRTWERLGILNQRENMSERFWGFWARERKWVKYFRDFRGKNEKGKRGLWKWTEAPILYKMLRQLPKTVVRTVADGQGGRLCSNRRKCSVAQCKISCSDGSVSNSGMVVLFYSKWVPPHLWCFRNSNRSLIFLIRSWDFTHRFINSLSGLIEDCMYIGKCHIYIYIYRRKCI
jgi:hypothetical protein